MPWLVAVQEGGETRTSLVCAAPRNVQGGSREVETGAASAATRMGMGWLGLGVLGVVVVGM